MATNPGPNGRAPGDELAAEANDSVDSAPPGATPAPDSTTLLAGNTIGERYLLVRLLGAGGMGSVYEARNAETSERVALKIVNARLIASSSDAGSRFRREARAAGAIESPHIVRVLESGVDDETQNLYLVMEYLEGEDLQQRLDRDGPLLPAAALRVAIQALRGLERAHAAGIVHRDIKPANVFLARGAGGEIEVKVLDFGIAKITEPLTSSHTAGLTDTGALLGSPLYMSPEQIKDSKAVDTRTDLWSLGTTLYAALAGGAPHKATESVGGILVAICSTPAPHLRSVAPWISPEIAAAVHRALVINPAMRYESVGAMLEALVPLVDGDDVLREESLAPMTQEQRVARLPPAATSDVGTEATLLAPEPPPADPAPASSPRRPRLGLVAAIAVALGAAALGAYRFGARAARDDQRVSSVIDAERLAAFTPLRPRPEPKDDAARARVALGRKLFSDRRLSKDGETACATCHPLDAWGTDGKRFSQTISPEPRRNTLGIYNVGGFFALLWDGRKDDLVAEALDVMRSPSTLMMVDERVLEGLAATPAYAKAYARAFPDATPAVSFDTTARAVAAFEETLITRGRWDRFLEGDRDALTEREKAGFNRFVDVGCVQCHFGPNVGATMFQKVGLVKAWPDTKDRGRFQITKREVDDMVFRVPSLRNVAKTAPYFHDGSVSSLPTAIRMMAHHQIGRELADEDVALIESWLVALTGDLPPQPPEAPE